MRLLLFLLLLPLLIYGQNNARETTSTQRLRLGVALQLDNGFSNSPFGSPNEFGVPMITRPDAFHLIGDFLPLQSVPYLWLNAEISYYQIATRNSQSNWQQIALWPGQIFFEETKMQYWHGGIGISLEPFTKNRISPYLGVQLLVIAPTSANYRFLRVDVNSNELIDDIQLQDGGQWATGWELNVGFRMRLNRRISAAVGYYQAVASYRADWPELQHRSFSDGIMELSRGGIEMRCSYGL